MEDVTEVPAEELEVTPEEDVSEEVTEEVPAEETEEVVEDVPEETSEDEIDVDQLVADILGNSSDIDEKVEDIKDEAQSSGNEELL